MVVAKIRICRKDKKLKVVVDISVCVLNIGVEVDQALLYHHEFTEVLSVAHYIVGWKIKPGVNATDKVVFKLDSSFKIIVVKHIVKLR